MLKIPLRCHPRGEVICCRARFDPLAVPPLHLATGATAARLVLRAVAVMLGLALASGVAGGIFAPQDPERLEAWQAFLNLRGVTDPEAFVRVGWIQNGNYLGALIGLVTALLWLRRVRRLAASSEGR